MLTTWRDAGELQKLNRRAGQEAVAISNDLAAALRHMLRLSSATGGAFDPGVGPLVERLRSGQDIGDRWQQHPRLYRIAQVLRLIANRATLQAGAALDAGGIGKGIALDAIVKHLREGGATAAYLDFGGSSQYAFGAPEEGHAWLVVLAGGHGGEVLGTYALRDGSLSTSRALPVHDPAGTIVDPRTGEPVVPPRLATVLASDATTAEVWSTALIVLGREGMGAVRAAGLQALVQDADGIVATEGLRVERLGSRGRATLE